MGLERLDILRMAMYEHRVYIVATSFDYTGEEPPEYDRIAEGLGSFSPEKAYILTNSEPREDMEEYEKQAKKRIKNIIKQEANISESNLETVPVPFYDSRQAFYELYDVIHEEKHVNGNTVQINLSGGTKPLALGTSQAASMLDVQPDPVWIAKRYKMDDGELTTYDYVDEEDAYHVNLFDISDPIPDNNKKSTLLHLYYEYGDEPIGLASVLEKGGVIQPIDEVSGEEEKKREDKRDTYYDPLGELTDQGFIEKLDASRKWQLTEGEGKHIARLSNIRHKNRNK